MKKPMILLIPAIVLAVAVGGCSSPQNTEDSPTDETNTEQVSGNNTDKTSSNAGTIKEEELEGALVESFPEDKVPLYPGTVTRSLGKMAEYLQKPEWAVDVTTTDSFSDVDNSIRKSYNSNGWSIRTDNKTALGGSLLVAHSDDYIVSINYEDMGDSGIEIHYGVSAK